jgi:sodium transport system permease protein
MQLKLVKVIFFKELKDILRDRRTLFVMIVLPLIVYPLLLIGYMQISMLQMGKLVQKKSRVVVIGRENAGELAAVLDSMKNITLLDSNGWQSKIVNGDLEAAVLVPPGFADSIAEGMAPKLALYHNGSKELSQKANGRLQDVIEQFRNRVVAKRLASLSADTSLLRPFALVEENLATQQQRQGDVVGRLLGYFLIIMTLMGAFYPAVDLTAGEKERGTLETLLVSPASRAEIVYGKFLTVLVVAMISALLNLLSIGGSLLFVAHSLGGAATNVLPRLAISPLSFLLALLQLVPLSVLFASLCIAVAVSARSYKEGQSMLTPISMLVIFPAMVSMMPGMEMTPLLAALPVANVSLLIKEYMMGNYLWLETLIAFCTSSLLAVAGLTWAVSQFEQESVLFRHAEDVRWSPFRRRRGILQQPYPSPATAFLLIVVEIIALFALGSSTADWGVVKSLVMTQMVIAALPLFILRRGGYDLKRVLGLHTPHPAIWPATVLLFAGGWLLVLELASLQNLVTPFPVEFLKRFETFFHQLGLLSLPRALLVVAILPGICEELLCRGFILHALKARFGKSGTIVLTAVIFSLLHMDTYRLLPTAALGFMLGWLVIETGSILPAMLGHALNNSLSFLVYKFQDQFNQISWLREDTTQWLPWYAVLTGILLITVGVIWIKKSGGSQASSDGSASA